MNGQVIQCFLKSDLRCGHDGLAALAKKDGIRVKDLVPGQYVVFINARQDRMKLYATNQVVAYIKPEGGRIDLNTVREIPRVFLASGKIDYEAALRVRIERELLPTGEKRKSGLAAPLAIIKQKRVS